MGQPLRNTSRAAAERAAGSSGQAKPAAKQKSLFREYAEALIVALGLALFIRTFFIQAYKIPSGSMEPTLLIGDHILVNKLIYGLRMPDSVLGAHVPGLPYGKYLLNLEAVHRGDVVVFVFPPDPTKDFIKRVVGVAGDTVEVKQKAVYLNGVKIDDSHAHYEPGAESNMGMTPRDNFGPLKVPEGKIFVMGDNRDRSYDSRFWGLVDRNEVEGKAMVIYWSWDSDSASLFPLRVSRFGKLVE
jgi:signal peptidase I